jgi:CheY-like chemotaxis protein/nitrate reductase NapAB chaperone NapD
MEKRVLIIDDEPAIRRNLTFGLTQEGYICTACPDGISAIHELNAALDKGDTYDYLITDIFMPDIDGMKILTVIKSQFPDLPVLVITGFGDDSLKAMALAETNTGYLDKPFEISELVEALEALSPGTAVRAAAEAEPEKEHAAARESISAYLTIHITDPDRSMEIFNELYNLDGVASCDAVRGDMDIIVLAQASSEEKIKALLGRVKAIKGVEVASLSPVERPKLDRDVKEFIEIYKKSVKSARDNRKKGTTSYIIVDIDKNALQQIFTTMFFVDELIFLDVIDNGTKLVGMVTGGQPTGRAPKVIEKLSQIDGVLRVREAKIIKMLDV